MKLQRTKTENKISDSKTVQEETLNSQIERPEKIQTAQGNKGAYEAPSL